jgi:iron complex outermembrane receptor protein
MSTSNSIRRAVRYALLAGATATAVTALPAGAQEASTISEVIVTGSRILRQDYEATSPVFTLDADVLRDAGTPQLEQVLNQLPQLVPSITTTSNNPSLGGQAQVDLRGLGTSRTLVLVDGGRVQPSTVGGVVDLNTIPASLIESIEIMTGGGSATYGSDAIAGVVNIRLKRNFEGVELSGQQAFSAESDGETTSASITMGGNFQEDRGNAVVMISYDKREEVFAGARDFSVVALGPDLAPLGSTSIPEGAYVPAANNPSTQAAYDAVFGAGAVPNSSWLAFNQDGSVFSMTPVVNFQGNTNDPGFNPANYSYNYSPVNYLQLPLERRQIAAFARYKLMENAEVYSRVTYTSYEAAQELAATPISAGIGSTIPVTNPFIPAALASILAARSGCTVNAANPTPCNQRPFTFNKRTTDVGPRNANNEYDVLQMVLGTRGDFDLGQQQWTWDLSASWGRTQRTESQTGNISRSRLQAAYDNPNALSARGCTGFNPFGEGNISPECATAVAIKTQNITVLESSGIVGAVSGGLFDLPAGTVQTAFGLEYRENIGEFRPDEFLASGDVVGFNAVLPVDGKIDVKEAFIEFSVPILADIMAIDYLGLDAGYRHSDYNLAGTTEAYMAGLEYRPIESVKVRASYQRAVRAPNVNELFRPQSEGFPAYTDPCWNTSPQRNGPDAAQVNALCAAQGAGANFPQGNSQVRALTGGNPELEPEFADTYTIGLVWQPQFQDNQFRVALDWFRYELDDVIGGVGAASIVSRCFNDQGANPTYDPNNIWCGFFSRNQAGIAENVQSTDQNLGKRNVDGVDLNLDFGREVGPGTASARLAATRLLKWQQQEDPASPLTNQEGTIGILVAETFPEWKANLRLGYSFSNFDFGWTLNYIDGMDVVNSNAGRTPVLVGIKPTVPSYVYHRLTAGWRPMEALRVTLGIDNLTDKDPPIYTSDSRAGIQANTDPSTYDVLGRRYFLNATYKF